MSEPLRGVVASHSDLAKSFVSAVHRITGISDALVAVSNEGCTRASLGERLRAAVGDEHAVLFVDLPAGSCLHAAFELMHENEKVAIVAGVNLAMLVDFVYRRDGTPAEAALRALEAGRKAIRRIPG